MFGPWVFYLNSEPQFEVFGVHKTMTIQKEKMKFMVIIGLFC